MSAKDGVYYIRKNGRTFVVVPVHARNDKHDGGWQNSGIQAAQRGSLSEEEATALLKQLGCTKVWDIPAGVSPNGVSEQVLDGTSAIVPKAL